MNHPEAIDMHSHIRFQETLVEETGQICRLYECPEMCGYQSFDEREVFEHINIGHAYDAEDCWVDNGDPPEPEDVHSEDVERPKLGRLNFTAQPQPPPPGNNQLYEYFNEQFVPEVGREAIIADVTTSEDVVPSYHFDPNQPGPSEPIVSAEIIFDGEEEIVEVSTEKIVKREVIGDEHLYGDMIIHQDLEEEGEENDDLDDEEQERVRVIVNPNPPKRGTKSLRDHHEATAAMTEMIVDASTLEMAAPSRHLKQGYLGIGRKKRGKKAENLDWIIDAVAKGVDVNDASPHIRKKPTLHKCEYCGKVDKYPSKIRAHMRTHTGEKPFKCEICGMAFSQKTPMRLHLRRHFDQKPYECDVDGCKERFVSGAILKLHIEKKHLNKKKYVCIRGCGRVFSSAFNQRHHEKKCSQNTYLTWVEEETTADDDESTGEYQEEDDEEYMDEMMDPIIAEPNQEIVEHFVEEPVFLHQ